jgi:hypothetical protein
MTLRRIPGAPSRHGLGAATLGGAIYLPGGASTQGFGAEDTNTVFRLE